MNATFIRTELKRVLRDPLNLFFTVGLPAMMYLIFGAANGDSEADLPGGNVAMFIMVSMAAYGAVTATTSVGGSAAVERMQGWGRQLGLTPMSDLGFVASKTAVAVVVTLVPILLIFALGVATGARGEARAWILSGLVVVAGAVLFALYGLAVGLSFRSESAVGIAGGGLVLLGFLGNLFFPLSGILLDIARFTPLYGYAQLARYPITDGYLPQVGTGTGTPGTPVHEPLWIPLTNVLVWAVVFAVLCLLAVRRSRGRQ